MVWLTGYAWKTSSKRVLQINFSDDRHKMKLASYTHSGIPETTRTLQKWYAAAAVRFMFPISTDAAPLLPYIETRAHMIGVFAVLKAALTKPASGDFPMQSLMDRWWWNPTNKIWSVNSDDVCDIRPSRYCGGSYNHGVSVARSYQKQLWWCFNENHSAEVDAGRANVDAEAMKAGVSIATQQPYPNVQAAFPGSKQMLQSYFLTVVSKWN